MLTDAFSFITAKKSQQKNIIHTFKTHVILNMGIFSFFQHLKGNLKDKHAVKKLKIYDLIINNSKIAHSI